MSDAVISEGTPQETVEVALGTWMCTFHFSTNCTLGSAALNGFGPTQDAACKDAEKQWSTSIFNDGRHFICQVTYYYYR